MYAHTQSHIKLCIHFHGRMLAHTHTHNRTRVLTFYTYEIQLVLLHLINIHLREVK